MKKFDKSTIAAAIVAAGVLTANQRTQAAAFSLGDLVIEQVGGTANYGAGAATLTNGGTAIFLDEFNPSNAGQTAPVQQIAVPTATSGSNLGVVESGTATSDGFLNRTVDGRSLTFTGYNTGLGGSTSIVGLANVPRVVGLVDSTGSINTTTSSTTANAANNFRSAVSTDGTTIYGAGAGSNTVAPTNIFTLGSSSSTGITTTTTISGTTSNVTNIRVTNIFTTAINAQSLYYSTGSGTNGVYTYSGLPTSSPATATLFVTDTAKSGGSPYGFSISPDGKTVYIADDGSVANGGGIQKYTSTTGAAGSFTLVATFATPARGLVVNYSGTNPVLYATSAATTNATVGNTLFDITDDGSLTDFSGQTATTLATAPGNTAFRGLTFAPTAVPEPATWTAGILSVLMLAWAFARRSLGLLGVRGA